MICVNANADRSFALLILLNLIVDGFERGGFLLRALFGNGGLLCFELLNAAGERRDALIAVVERFARVFDGVFELFLAKLERLQLLFRFGKRGEFEFAAHLVNALFTDGMERERLFVLAAERFQLFADGVLLPGQLWKLRFEPLLFKKISVFALNAVIAFGGFGSVFANARRDLRFGIFEFAAAEQRFQFICERFALFIYRCQAFARALRGFFALRARLIERFIHLIQRFFALNVLPERRGGRMLDRAADRTGRAVFERLRENARLRAVKQALGV